MGNDTPAACVIQSGNNQMLGCRDISVRWFQRKQRWIILGAVVIAFAFIFLFTLRGPRNAS